MKRNIIYHISFPEFVILMNGNIKCIAIHENHCKVMEVINKKKKKKKIHLR